MSLTKYNVSFDAKPQQQELFLLFSFRKHVRFFILLRQQQKDRGNGYLFPPKRLLNSLFPNPWNQSFRNFNRAVRKLMVFHQRN